MDIYIDAIGLKEYLKQFFDAIRMDHDIKNNQIFNLSFKDILLDKIFRSQNILWDIPINQSIDRTVPIKDRSLIRKTGSDKMNQILDLFKDESYEFSDFFHSWYRISNISTSPKNERSKFQDESSLSLAEGVNYSHNPHSMVDRNRLLKCLGKLFFVDKETLNRMVFTRDMKGWGILSQAMEQEKDIVIVDRYFFKDDRDENKDSDENKDRNREVCSFIKDLCKKDFQGERNIVIFSKNNVHFNKLKEFTEEVNKEGKICNITFVLLNSDWAKMKLHDRVIISNHRIICSGHSFPLYFKYVNTKEKLFSANGSMYVTIGSVADKSNEIVMQSVLSYLQNEIIDCKKEGVYYIYSIDNLYKSNLLSFPKLQIKHY